MKTDQLVKIGLAMTDGERKKEMQRLLNRYPVPKGASIAKIGRDEDRADAFDDEWDLDRNFVDDLERRTARMN